MDAVVFSILTIILCVCTCRLFVYLQQLSHENKKQKLLIGSVCALFTISYIARALYLFFETIDSAQFTSDCELEYNNVVLFLSLLPLFDFFPCATILLFDSIRLAFGKKRRAKPAKDGLSIRSEVFGSDGASTRYGRYKQETTTDDFGTYEGDSNTSVTRSFGPSNQYAQ